MNETLGKRIMTYRKSLGLTQDQLAEQLGVTAQAVSKWENDQSCPDISTLPKLSEIFNISTDILLGINVDTTRNLPTTIPETEEEDSDDSNIKTGSWTFYLNNEKNGITFAIFVLTVGILYLLSKLLEWDISFWNILWPSSFLVLGLAGLYPKFSLFNLGCALIGGYFLLHKIIPLPISPDSGILFAVVIVIFGIRLLIDALRKQRKHFRCDHINTDASTYKQKNNLFFEENSFSYMGSFGECSQHIDIPTLIHGDINVTFGEYDLDFSGVETICDNCTLNTKCSFGELTLLIPKRFTVKQRNSAVFAEITTSGIPDKSPEGTIFLDAKANFGVIEIKYI